MVTHSKQIQNHHQGTPAVAGLHPRSGCPHPKPRCPCHTTLGHSCNTNPSVHALLAAAQAAARQSQSRAQLYRTQGHAASSNLIPSMVTAHHAVVVGCWQLPPQLTATLAVTHSENQMKRNQTLLQRFCCCSRLAAYAAALCAFLLGPTCKTTEPQTD